MGLFVFIVCHDFSTFLEGCLATAYCVESWLEFVGYWGELVGSGVESFVGVEQVFFEAFGLKLVGTLWALEFFQYVFQSWDLALLELWRGLKRNMHVCIVFLVLAVGPGPESFAIPLYFLIIFKPTASSHFPYITQSLLSLILTPKLAYLSPISINTFLADTSFIFFSPDYGPFSRKSSRSN